MGGKQGFFTGPDGAARDQQLLDLVATGDHSFLQIAIIMGAPTRNVVLCRFGRIRKRLGAANVPPARPAIRPQNRPKMVAVPKPKPSPPVSKPIPEESSLELILLDGASLTEENIKHNMCRYPIGDPGSVAFRYCGHPKEGNPSYCPVHQKKCYQPNIPRVNHLGRKRA